MPSGARPLLVAFLLLIGGVFLGAHGSLLHEDASEELEPLGMWRALAAPQAPGEPTLERFEVDPKEDPPRVGTTVAIRAVVDKGRVDGPVELNVTVHREHGATHLDSSSAYPGKEATLVTAYWDAQTAGPYRVDASVTVGETTLEAPQETGHVQPADTEPSEDTRWLGYLVEGTLLWALVLAGLGLASRWARDLDGSKDRDG